MFGKTANVVIFVVLWCFAYTSGQDYYEDYEDGAPYYGDIPGIQFTDGNITMTELEKIVRDEVKAATNEILEKMTAKFLGDNRLEDKINLVREKTLDKERECRSKNYSYWDAGIPECRNCLEMDRCQKNEACSRECRDILKILHLETAAADKEQQLQDHERNIASMQNTIVAQQKDITILKATNVATFALGFVAFVVFFFWIRKLKLSSPTEATSDRSSAKPQQKKTRRNMWQTIRLWFSRNSVAKKKASTPQTSRLEGSGSEGTTPEYDKATSGENESLTNNHV